MARVDFTGVDSPDPYALTPPQSDTERLLEEHLFGRDQNRNAKRKSSASSRTGMASRRCHQGQWFGKELAVDLLIGRHGAHSAVRHGLGLSFLGDTLQSDWILADLHLSDDPLPLRKWRPFGTRMACCS